MSSLKDKLLSLAQQLQDFPSKMWEWIFQVPVFLSFRKTIARGIRPFPSSLEFYQIGFLFFNPLQNTV